MWEPSCEPFAVDGDGQVWTLMDSQAHRLWPCGRPWTPFDTVWSSTDQNVGPAARSTPSASGVYAAVCGALRSNGSTEHRRPAVSYCCPPCQTRYRTASTVRVARQLCAGGPIGEPCHDSWPSLRVRGQRVEGEAGRRSRSGRSGRSDFAGAINCLAALLTVIDSLDQVTQVVAVHGLVDSTPENGDQAAAMNGASDLMVDVFGEPGR